MIITAVITHDSSRSFSYDNHHLKAFETHELVPTPAIARVTSAPVDDGRLLTFDDTVASRRAIRRNRQSTIIAKALYLTRGCSPPTAL